MSLRTPGSSTVPAVAENERCMNDSSCASLGSSTIGLCTSVPSGPGGANPDVASAVITRMTSAITGRSVSTCAAWRA